MAVVQISLTRYCERSEAIQQDGVERCSPVLMGCFVASLFAMKA